MMNPPKIVTPHATLRLLLASETELMVDYYRRNRSHLLRWEPRRNDAFYHHEFWQQELIRRQLAFKDGMAQHLVAICDDQIIACINFTQIDANQSHGCFLGYSIDAQYQGQGKMVPMLSAALKHLFCTWQIPRVTAGFMPANQRSGALLRKLGFGEIGIARDYLEINGDREDHMIMVKQNPFQQYGW